MSVTTSPANPTLGAKPRVVSPFNPANAVTASRFLTLPPFFWAVSNGYHQYAMLFILICGLLDKVDGLVAKLFDCRSPFGEVFDAIADGICYGFAMIVVAVYGWAPAFPVFAVIGLGVLNTGLRFVYAKRAGRAINYKSYAMERVVGFIGFLIGFATGGMEVDYYYWWFLPLFALVVLHDTKRMLFDGIPGADR
ncbi:MAG: CDP-alcohol phosphatidyltransferase family protein [Deltaproteobacteria bacterium]|nr:CDP-alcohol phosphatidyltransferase family protein [Deltaproteobacteria bacterium]MDQ3299271.1 CDP-alcohol phosphatidyltransferase family protein [Myxococcota bacterium]